MHSSLTLSVVSLLFISYQIGWFILGILV